MLNPFDADRIAALKSLLPGGTIFAADARYLEEPRGLYHSATGTVAKPRNTQEVATIVRFCAEHGVGVVPYGGGTGLVGGQVKPDGPAALIVSLERMSAIVDLQPADNTLTCQAGAILANIQTAADGADRMFPLSLASEASCQIGGNLATNAGGVQVLRYGNTRDLCLGIEAVLPDGTIFDGLSGLRKDNTGYDLRHLLIGAEGSLGIITAAVLKLVPKPRHHTTAVVAVTGPAAATAFLAILQDYLDGSVSAFELMHRHGMDFLAEHAPDVRLPLDPVPDWSVLCGATSGIGGDMEDRFLAALEVALEQGLIHDAVLAQSQAQRDALWQVRERIPEANRLVGSVSSHDISVPIGRIPDFISDGFEAVAQLGDFRVNCFGHLGDGNLHYNVFPPVGRSKSDYAGRRGTVLRCIHDLVHHYGGSISAEHGIGRSKVAELELYGDPGKVAAIKLVKRALDPLGIMNPGAVVHATDYAPSDGLNGA